MREAFQQRRQVPGVVLIAPWTSGCERVTTEYDPASDRFFVLNTIERTIHVFARKAEGKESPKTAVLKAETSLD